MISFVSLVKDATLEYKLLKHASFIRLGMTYIDVSRYRLVLSGSHYFHISIVNIDREFII